MPFRKRVSVGFFTTLGCLLSATCAFAKPSGFHLKAGHALPPVQKNGTFLIESGDHAVIDWTHFSIGRAEHVVFQQLHEKSSVLNRVTGVDQSQLLGKLSSNGKVYLVNPNGILIGPEARIETAGFIASTLDLLDQDLSGGVLSFAGESEASVINQGVIRCPAGDVFLIGKTVESSGQIRTPRGRQGLLSGCEVVIRPTGAPQIRIRSEEEIEAQLLEENPFALAIRHSGELEGEAIYIVAEEGLCEVTGKVKAVQGEKGGQVRILGDQIALFEQAVVDVSGERGGGEILVGGDYQGKHPEIRNAKQVYLGREVKIYADALQEGNGGKVIFWGDETMIAYGMISAEGGPVGGDGGFVEISSPGGFIPDAAVSTAAPKGKNGLLYLDPCAVTISASADANNSFAANAYTFSAATATINIPNLIQNLSNGNVTIDATASGTGTASITIADPIAGEGGGTGGTSWTNSNLTLNGGTAITLNTSCPISWNGTGTLSMTTTAGAITLNSLIWNKSTATGFTAVSLTASGGAGLAILTNNITTIGGNITISGTCTGNNTGVKIGAATTITSTNGNVQITGTGGSGVGCCNWGVILDTNCTFNMTGSGTLSISGTGGTCNCAADGIYFNPCSFSIKDGGASIIGQGGNGTGNQRQGLNIPSATTWTLNGSGSFILTGTGGVSGSSGGCGIPPNHGIGISAAFSVTATNSATGGFIMQGTAGTSTNGVAHYGVSFSSTTSIDLTGGSGSVGITGTGGSGSTTGGQYGINFVSGSSIKVASGGAITLSGTGSGGGSSSANHGVNLAGGSFSIVNGTLTFNNCTGGAGTGSHGVHVSASTTVTATGSGGVVFSNCLGGTSGGNGINIGATFTASTNITATTAITGRGSNGIGFNLGGNFSATGSSSSSITIAATGSATGTGYGIQLASGTMSTNAGGSITLTGTGGTSTTSVSTMGVYFSGGIISTLTGGGNISITGNASGNGGTSAIYMITANSIISNTGTISLTGNSTASGSGSIGININALWTTQTTGTVTFSGTGGSGTSSHGFQSVGGTFTTSGPVVFSNCVGGGNGTAAQHGINITTAFSISGNLTATNSIQGRGVGGCGIASSANITVGGDVTLVGSSTGVGSAANGISLTGGTLSTTGSNKTIQLSGSAGVVDSSYGVATSGTAAITASSGNITFINCSGGTGTSFCRAVSLNGGSVTAGGTMTFQNCVGGGGASGVNNFGVFVQTSGSISAPTIIATNTIQSGPGSQGGAYGFFIYSGTVGGASTTNLQITATAGGSNATSVSTGGIVLESGATIQVASGTCNLTGIGPTASSAAFASGVYGILFKSGSVLNLGSATATLTGTNSAVTVSGSNGNHGISFLGTLQTNNGSVTWSGAGAAGSTNSNSGVNYAPASQTLSGVNTFTFSNCTGGLSSGGTCVGVNFTSSLQLGGGTINFNDVTGGGSGSSTNNYGVFIPTGITVDAATIQSGGTNHIRGGNTSGTGNHGLYINGGTLGNAAAARNITLTATARGSGASSFGVALDNNGLVTSTSGTVALTGTGSSGGGATCHGISISGTTTKIQTTTGTISLTGTAGSGSGSFGTLFALASPLITGGGPISVAGTVGLSTGVTLDTTNGGGTGTGANITLSGAVSNTTGNQTLTLTAGSAGGVSLNTIGSTGSRMNLSFSSGNALSLGGNIYLNNTNFAPASTMAAALTASITINAGSGSITFPSTLTGTSTGGQDLTLTTTGGVALNGNIGAIHLGALTISSGSSGLSFGSGITSLVANSLTVGSSVVTTLNNSNPLTIDTSASGSINFGGALTGAGAGGQGLTLTASNSGSVILSGNVGATRLGAFTIGSGSGSLSIGASVSNIAANSFAVAGPTPASTTFNHTLTIDTSVANGAIDFEGTVDGAAAGLQNLTLTAGTGVITFSGRVGGVAPLGVLSATGSQINVADDISTQDGAITLTGPVVLAGDLEINTVGSATGADISFTSTITGAQALILTAGSTHMITLGGAVGTALTPLDSLHLTAASLSLGGNIYVNSDFSLPIATTLAGNSTIDTANHPLTLSGTFTGASAGSQSLALQAGTSSVTLSTAVGSPTPLGAFSATGSSIDIADDISTKAGAITLTGPVTLAGDLTISSAIGAATGADITFSSTITGAQGLTVAAGSAGVIRLGGAVGTLGTPLTSLSLSGALLRLGNNIYIDGGPLTISMDTVLTGSPTINTDNQDLTFSGTIEGTNTSEQSLTLQAGAGAITLSDTIGGTVRLGDVNIATASELRLGSSVRANSLSIAAPIPTTLSLVGLTAIDTTGAISFGGILKGTVDGQQPLTLLAGSGSVTFSDTVGVSKRLGALTISTAAGVSLPATVAANSVTISSPIPTTLSASTTLIDTSAVNGSITLGGTVIGTMAGAQALTLTPGAGSITLGNAVGLGTALGAISIPSVNNLTASSSIIASSLTQTTGSGTSTFNGELDLSGALSLSGNNFTINRPVSATNVAITNTGTLSIGSSGDMDLTGAFTQSGGGPVQTAGSVTTAGGNIHWTDAVELRGNVVFDTGESTGEIRFYSTVDGGYGLRLFAHEVQFDDEVGEGDVLGSLRVTAETITLGGDQTVAIGPMIYNGSVILTQDTTLTDSGSIGMSFQQPLASNSTPSISGNYDLILQAFDTSITVEGDIDLAGTSGSAGGSLTAAAGTGFTCAGQILTEGGSASPGTGGAGGDVSITCSAGSISVHNINVSGGDGTVVNGDGGNILLQPSSGYSGDYPLGVVILNEDLSLYQDGNLVSVAGSGIGVAGSRGAITLSANRSSSSKVATVVSSSSGNDVFIAGGDLTLGAYEAITVLGDLIIMCSGTVTLGDTVALDALVIVSMTNNLRLHSPYDILDNSGNLYSSPTLHYLGGSDYLRVGTEIPAGNNLNGQNLGLSPSTFRPLLFYNGHILNYDTSPRPVPTVFFVPIGFQQFALYQLGIADAQLSDLLPIYSSPLPSPYLLKTK